MSLAVITNVRQLGLTLKVKLRHSANGDIVSEMCQCAVLKRFQHLPKLICLVVLDPQYPNDLWLVSRLQKMKMITKTLENSAVSDSGV